MHDEITVNHVEPQAIVSVRQRQAQRDLPAFIEASIPQLLTGLRALGVAPSGPPFVIYHEFSTEGVDAEVAVPIREPVARAGELESRVLPATTIARTVHLGPYEGIADTYSALWTWVGSHGFEAAGPARERYVNGPADRVPSSEYRTEIEMPIVPVAVAAPV